MPKYRSTGLSLPRRTLDYLQRGAAEGMRNAELFDATCQFRDAGHPLEETEAQLLARALADGGSPVNEAALVKDLGTRFEQESVQLAADLLRQAERQALRSLDLAEARRDRLAQRLAEIAASDADLADLSETRTARAFMLLGRVTGTFD